MDTKAENRKSYSLRRGLGLNISLDGSKSKVGRSQSFSYSKSKPCVYSPVTDLAMNLCELSTSYDETPKRRMSSSNRDDTPVSRAFNKQLSMDDGCCLDSPCLDLDSPFIHSRFGSLLSKADCALDERSPLDTRSSAYRRFQSMPVPFCGFDPSPSSSHTVSRHEHDDADFSPRKLSSPDKTAFCIFDDEENSKDSGLGLDKDKVSPSKDIEFKFPLAPAPRNGRVLADETNSPKHYSPSRKSPRPVSAPAGTLHFPSGLFSGETASPIKLRKSSLTFSPEQDDGDDGFLDIMDVDEQKANANLPKSLKGLFSAPLMSADENENTPEKKMVARRGSLFSSLNDSLEEQENERPSALCKRGLFKARSSNDLRTRLFSCKRLEPFKEEDAMDTTPRQLKRRKSVMETKPSSPSPRLQRCHSEADCHIKTALNRTYEQENLIGDFSKHYCLPLIPGKHQDLKSITPDTLRKLMNHEYSDTVESFRIIDCRYPYEYNGGHIKEAENIYRKDNLLEELYNPEQLKNNSEFSFKRKVIIFHCEFSSERAPGMCRFLRREDRSRNTSCYPSLDYPELYILDGGYKAFFESHKDQCLPQLYKPMLHEDHFEDLRMCRAKSKSWAGEKRSFRMGLKF